MALYDILTLSTYQGGFGINSEGQIVGEISNSAYEIVPAWWSPPNYQPNLGNGRPNEQLDLARIDGCGDAVADAGQVFNINFPRKVIADVQKALDQAAYLTDINDNSHVVGGLSEPVSKDTVFCCSGSVTSFSVSLCVDANILLALPQGAVGYLLRLCVKGLDKGVKCGAYLS
jgi:hypothetical protein